jgi:hypothetical protein
VISCRHILALFTMLAVSCASSDKAAKPAAPELKPLSQRLNQKNGYKQDTQGNWVPQNDQRSSFESKGKSPYFQGEYARKSYQTTDYAKKSWWGNKDYGRKPYAGDTDGSRFQKKSRFSQQGAPESDTAADLPGAYQTGTYATGAARETGRDGISKPSDTETDIRRRVYQSPEIIDWREQRSLSLEQSKGILGH